MRRFWQTVLQIVPISVRLCGFGVVLRSGCCRLETEYPDERSRNAACGAVGGGARAGWGRRGRGRPLWQCRIPPVRLLGRELDVYPTGGSQLVAHSLIESVYNGCGVRENWMPLKAENSGGSLNSYVSAERLWRQTWIDSSGARVDFQGGWNGTTMILEGYWRDFLAPGKGATVRMTYSRAADGSVRQLGETSGDGGKTWRPGFDFTYRPARG